MQNTNSIFGLKKRVVDFSSKLVDQIIPPTCLICHTIVTRQGGCCARCWREMRLINQPMCPVLGTPFSIDMGEGIISAEAIANPPPFERLRAVMLYDDYARKLVSMLKYSDRPELAKWMAIWMRRSGNVLLNDADVIIPIPLHPARLRQRKFNQSAELARHCVSNQNHSYMPLTLQRRKSTRQQVGLSERQRADNVSGAFVVPQSEKIHLKGKRVLLVDDVYTSGATVNAATRALKRGGVKSIDVLVFAKVETTEL
ncbi:MAG: ComF family protein [Pseudomonadota bacterium]